MLAPSSTVNELPCHSISVRSFSQVRTSICSPLNPPSGPAVELSWYLRSSRLLGFRANTSGFFTRWVTSVDLPIKILTGRPILLATLSAPNPATALLIWSVMWLCSAVSACFCATVARHTKKGAPSTATRIRPIFRIASWSASSRRTTERNWMIVAIPPTATLIVINEMIAPVMFPSHGALS